MYALKRSSAFTLTEPPRSASCVGVGDGGCAGGGGCGGGSGRDPCLRWSLAAAPGAGPSSAPPSSKGGPRALSRGLSMMNGP
eukprot:2881482-Prymnesium_polylepis.1